MSAEKAQLRQQLIGRMRQLSDDDVKRASKTASEHAFAQLDWSEINSVLSYMPIENAGEIDPRYLTEKLKGLQIEYAGSSKDVPLPINEYDVIIVPVVGFNAEGYRIGRGGGWYDRLLAAHPEAIAIGLAHAWSAADFVPEPHDMRLTHIFTDETDAIR